MKFTSLIHLENENVIDFYIVVNASFKIPHLETVLEFYETDIAGLQSLFNDKSFFEGFSENFHLVVTEMEYLN